MLKSVAGRQVPFMPQQFPTRLSRRVGLRTMPSIGGKVPCPSGEQMINGDFETGDSTGWTLNSGIIQSITVHAGTYAARIYPAGARRLEQTLATAVLVSCVQSFGLWYQYVMGGAGAFIYYIDGTYTYYDLPIAATWTSFDLKTNLTAGKTIEILRIIGSGDTSTYIDDVSLIGTG